MKLINPNNPAMASWLRELGHRLDAPPFLSGAIEAKKTLDRLTARKDSLSSVTQGGLKGIIHAGRIPRIWVEDQDHGIPFLSSTDILESDLSKLRHISKRAVSSNPKLIIHTGWTLITRSGTIGRTAYARPEMDGMSCTEDVLRVAPNEKLIPGGYLYAFLSSRFGVPIITSGTYGAIIQHIEPEHISDLPVPRFGDKLENKVHELITTAGELRSEARLKRDAILGRTESYIGWKRRRLTSLSTETSSRRLSRRMDAFHHSEAVQRARNTLSGHADAVSVHKIVEEVFEPNRGGRMKVDDESFGVPFLSSSAVFRLDPTAEYLVSKKTPNLDRLLLTENDLLLPRSGQLGGIIGRAVLPLPKNLGSAASEHLVRIRCSCRDDAYYLWAVFASQPGYFAAIATAFGTSIPSLDCELLSKLQVPWNTGQIRSEICSDVSETMIKLSQAIEAEREAISLVEQAIEGNA